MKLPPQIFGTLIKRYKRFFADIQLEDGSIITSHIANTGPMTSCWSTGFKGSLTPNDDPKKKLKFGLNLTNNGESWIVVNTHLPNKIVGEALSENRIPEFSNATKIQSEFSIGDSRFDFCIEKNNQRMFLEIKSATSIDANKVCYFPDTVSERALKHVNELRQLNKKGEKTFLLFLVGREDSVAFRPAKEIQPEYYEACKKAHAEGVILLAYQCKVSPEEIILDKPVNIILD